MRPDNFSYSCLDLLFLVGIILSYSHFQETVSVFGICYFAEFTPLFCSIESAIILSQPSSPVRVLEGQPLKLEWTFSVQGTFRRVQLGFLGSPAAFVEASLSSIFIEAAFSDRLTLSTTKRNATVTFFSMNRTDSANYVFGVLDTTSFAQEPLEVRVQCKYTVVCLLCL